MQTSSVIKPGIGDIVVSKNPLIYAIEIFGSSSWRSFEWYQSSSIKEGWKQVACQLTRCQRTAIRIAQAIFFFISASCFVFKALCRFFYPGVDEGLHAWMEQSSKDDQEKKAYFIIGPIGAGKTCYSKQIIEATGATLSDLDQYRENTITYKYLQSAQEPQVNQITHQVSAALRNQDFTRQLECPNLVINGIGKDVEGLKTWVIRPLQEKGFKISMIYLAVEHQLCLDDIVKTRPHRIATLKEIEESAKDASIAYAALKPYCNTAQKLVRTRNSGWEQKERIENKSPKKATMSLTK